MYILYYVCMYVCIKMMNMDNKSARSNSKLDLEV